MQSSLPYAAHDHDSFVAWEGGREADGAARVNAGDGEIAERVAHLLVQRVDDVADVLHRVERARVRLLEGGQVEERSAKFSAKTNAEGATYVFLRLVEHDEAAGALVENAKEELVEDHLAQPVEAAAEGEKAGSASMALRQAGGARNTHLVSTDWTGWPTCSAM